MSEKRNKRKVGAFVLAAFIIAILLFIWGNSLQTIPQSKMNSLDVQRWLTPVLEFFVGSGNVTNHLVRKLAHFAEFFLLGGAAALLMIFLRQKNVQAVINCLFIGLFVAVADETIQIFSNRGAQVQDILLDFAGAATGIVLVWLAYAAAHSRNRKK